MAEPVWGLLEKSQVDNETIEQAIARLIVAHLADAAAHAAAAESLEVHKDQSIVDHPAKSVVDDKWDIRKFEIKSTMESLDGWSITADDQLQYLGFAEIFTSAVLNNVASMEVQSDDELGIAPDKTKNPIFEAVVLSIGGFAHEMRLGIAPLDVNEGVGFRTTLNQTFIAWKDGDENYNETEIVGIDESILHKYRVEIDSGDEIRWYIDNVLVHTEDISVVGVWLEGGPILHFWVKNLAAGHVPGIGLYRVLFQQDF